MKMYSTETKRGRPKTGRNPTIKIMVPNDLLRQIDKIASRGSERRAETIRRLLRAGARADKDFSAEVRKSFAAGEDWP